MERRNFRFLKISSSVFRFKDLRSEKPELVKKCSILSTMVTVLEPLIRLLLTTLRVDLTQSAVFQ